MSKELNSNEEVESYNKEKEKERINCKNDSKGMTLQLGDIIYIKDPTDDRLNNQLFIIDYIDSHKIKLINEGDLKTIELKINDNVIGNGTITEIDLLHRNEKEGYAKQNDLLPGKWINIHFGGDLPVVMTGEITNLEEDMIEVKLIDDQNSIIYLNFDYKGIPEDLPIENIEIRQPPSSININKVLERGESIQLNEDIIDIEGQEVEEVERKEEEREEEQDIPKDLESRKENLKKKIIEADQIEFGEYLNPIEEFKDINKEQYRYNIDTQTNDLLDELLSNIPTNQRTNSVLNNIHIMITRFLQLREIGSVFDKNKNVTSIIKKSSHDKPLADYLSNYKNNLYWIMMVAQNIKKVYNVDEIESPDIAMLNTFESISKIEELFNVYKSNISNEFKYNNLYKSLNDEMTPFISVSKNINNNIISENEVTSNMNVIIDNLGDLQSSVAKNSKIINQRFVIQKYNLGLNRLEATNMKGSNMIAHTINLTPNDTISIKSILTLPEPTVQFSLINLPGSSIFTKSNLNLHFLNYWQLLKKNTVVDTITIDNLDTELNYDSNNFINNIKNYILTLTPEQQLKKEGSYKKFLNIIIPKIKILFNLVKKYIKGKLSLVDLVSYLEPFMIYPNDLTYMQYIEINKFLKEKIVEFNKNFIENSRKMALLKNLPFQKNNANILLEILNSNDSVKSTVMEKYHLMDNNEPRIESDSEILKKITLEDFGNLYNTSIAFENISLMFPNELNAIFELDKNKLNTLFLKDSENNTCKNYIISKKYLSKEELQMDNGKILYFDKEYDNTPYTLLENFQKEQSKLSPNEFSLFLSEKLQKKYKYRLEDAEYIAESLTNGNKQIKDGQYAIFIDETNKNEIKYFMRKNNQWIEDKGLDKNLFLNDNESMCLVQPKCIFNEKEKKEEQQCETLEMNKDTIVGNALNEILNQFDQKYDISKEELKNRLNKYLERYATIFDKLEFIHKFNFYKYNNIQYDLGLLAKEEEIQVFSPYIALRDLILGQNDFIKKQNDIIQFASKYTRYYKETEANIQDGTMESKYWLYCKETNTKLLPTFLYTLAKVFIQNPTIYDNSINNIIKDQGALSDDGESWVDKYSGYVIKAIDWDTEEGYEEGFKIVSREVLEQDLGPTTILTKLNKKYMNPQSQVVYNIISSLSSFMGINIDDSMEFIINIVTNLINDSNIMEKELTYNKRMEEMAKKGKKLPEYKLVYNSAFLYLTLGMYLIAIQTSVPSIRSRKTFPGCVRSFTGFPLQGEGEYSGLNYIACVANGLKSSTAPWFVLQRMKEDKIADKIKAFIIQYLIPNQEVNEKIKNKLEYLTLYPEEEIPVEHSLEKWSNFLPPLVKFKIKGLQNISDGYLDLLLKDIRIGSNRQNEKLLVIESKIIQFSLAIQESIQKIIEKKELLLKNSIHPYMDNACCNEELKKNKNDIPLTTLQYFMEINNEIGQFNEIIRQLTSIIADVNSLTESGMFLSKINTKRFYPRLSSTYTENTIYQSFIKYCNFNNLIPINNDLLVICKNKPDFMLFNDSLEEKIGKLKRDGRQYTEEGMLRLIQIVSRNNIIETNLNTSSFTPIQRLRDLLEDLDKTNDETVAKSFIQLLNTNLDTYDLTVTEDTENMRKFKNYLENSNSKMRKQLLDFIKQKAKIKSTEFKKVENFINNMTVWELDKSTRNENIKIADDAMYNYIQYFKSFNLMMVKVYPNMILNKKVHTIYSPKYWGLSKNHSLEIKKMVENYYSSIESFYGKVSIHKILLQIQEKCKNILLLSTETPAYTSIKSQFNEKVISSIFDKRTSTLLNEYYTLQIFTSYIDLTDNPFMVKRLVPEINKNNINLLNMEEIIVETVEPDYIAGDMSELKTIIAKLLSTYIFIMNNTKNNIDISYDKVMDRVFKLREKEKDTFTDRLRDLTDEAREVDTILKINKLGNWNKGLLKGLKEYDPENYDQEKIVMQNVAELERKIRKENRIEEGNIDILMNDYVEDMEAHDIVDAEERSMSNMNEDYMDGYDYNEIEEVEENEYD